MGRLSTKDRVGSAGVILGLAALVAVAASVMLFVLDLRKVATRAVESEEQLRAVIQTRCQARLQYDQRVVDAAAGDLAFYVDLLAAAEVAVKDGPPLTPDQLRLYAKQKAIFQEAIERKQAIVAQGVIGSCEQYDAVRVATSRDPAAYGAPTPVEERS